MTVYRPKPPRPQKWGTNSTGMPLLPADPFSFGANSDGSKYAGVNVENCLIVRLADGLAVYASFAESDGSDPSLPLNAGTTDTSGAAVPDDWMLLRAIKVDQNTGEVTLGPKYYLATIDNTTSGFYYSGDQVDGLVRLNNTDFLLAPNSEHGDTAAYVFRVDSATLNITRVYRDVYSTSTTQRGYGYNQAWDAGVENYAFMSLEDGNLISPTASSTIIMYHWDGTTLNRQALIPTNDNIYAGCVCYLSDAVYLVVNNSSALAVYKGNSTTLSNVTAFTLVGKSDTIADSSGGWGTENGLWDPVRKELLWGFRSASIDRFQILRIPFTGLVTELNQAAQKALAATLGPTEYFNLYTSEVTEADPNQTIAVESFISSRTQDGQTSDRHYTLIMNDQGHPVLASTRYYYYSGGTVDEGPHLRIFQYDTEDVPNDSGVFSVNPPGWEQVYPYWWPTSGFGFIAPTCASVAYMGNDWYLVCWVLDIPYVHTAINPTSYYDSVYVRPDGYHVIDSTPMIRAVYAPMYPLPNLDGDLTDKIKYFQV